MAGVTSKSDAPSTLVVAGLAGVTAVGFVFRLVSAQQSLFGDELYTYAVVSASGITALFDGIHATENTPPLFYILSWLSGKLGDPGAIRAPSVIFGTAAIPITYVLGHRLSGWRVGLFAATLVALAPAAIFYGSDARAYAMAMFLVPLSTVALLSALESRRISWWWWGTYFVAATAAAYTHYSVIFILVAQVAWALWRYRERWREIAVANAAAVLAYLPWLPNVRRNPEIFFAEENHPFTLAEFGQTIREVLPGRTLMQLSEVPGRPAMVLLALAGAAIVGGLALAYSESLHGVPGRAREWAQRAVGSELSLLVMILIATPIGIAAYSAVETSLLAPRNFVVALPFACVLIGIMVLAIRRPLSIAAAALTIAALLIGGLRSVDDANRRAAFKAAADVVTDGVPAGTPVLQFPSFAGLMESNLFPDLDEHPLRQDLALYLPADYQTHLREREWPGAQRVLVVGPAVDVIYELYNDLAASNGARLAERTTLPGVVPIAISEYRATGA